VTLCYYNHRVPSKLVLSRKNNNPTSSELRHSAGGISAENGPIALGEAVAFEQYSRGSSARTARSPRPGIAKARLPFVTGRCPRASRPRRRRSPPPRRERPQESASSARTLYRPARTGPALTRIAAPRPRRLTKRSAKVQAPRDPFLRVSPAASGRGRPPGSERARRSGTSGRLGRSVKSALGPSGAERSPEGAGGVRYQERARHGVGDARRLVRQARRSRLSSPAAWREARAGRHRPRTIRARSRNPSTLYGPCRVRGTPAPPDPSSPIRRAQSPAWPGTIAASRVRACADRHRGAEDHSETTGR